MSTSANSWNQLGDDCLSAAHQLHRTQRFRSATSRAYYAMYSYMTGLLIHLGTNVSIGDFSNPGHKQLQGLIRDRIASHFTRSDLKNDFVRKCRRLLLARLTADYKPGLAHGKNESLSVLRDIVSLKKLIDHRWPE